MLFLSTLIAVFFMVLAESVNLILQLRGKFLTKWFGKRAFDFNKYITVSLWSLTFLLYIVLQFKEHPLFHSTPLLKYVGLAVGLPGLGVSVWGYKILGSRPSLCLNFFEEDTAVVHHFLYRYVKHPEDFGLWTALFGYAFFTASLWNLIIAAEFVLVMTPHIYLESIPLKRKREAKERQRRGELSHFKPELWDKKQFVWGNKRFIQKRVLSLFYRPLNFCRIMKWLEKRVEKAGGEHPDALCLVSINSPWSMTLNYAVNREIPGCNNCILSGTWISRVYEGTFRSGLTDEFNNWTLQEGFSIKRIYYWYTACLKCADKSYKEYTVVLAEFQ